MCNLYAMTATVDEMRRLFGSFGGDTANLPPLDEIYPGHLAPVLRNRPGGGLEMVTMRWGFPGPKASGGRPVTNVRNLSSPFWRGALAAPERRCLVPATRFCEWTEKPDPASGRKVKCWFGMKDGADELFAFAGLWRPGDSASAEPYMAFLTCPANATVGAVHPKAMPVILTPGGSASAWLEGSAEDACALAVPFADTDMRRVS